MENLSRSASKKVYNGNGFAAQTVYDDVFGVPPKFGIPTLSPRVEDYTEIFGCFHASRASSIPILDLPAVDDADFSFDVRSSHFDYSEVFGGFTGLDFAVSFEELFNQSKTAYDSSEEAWTPAQSESLSDESDPSVCSERNQSLSNEEFYQSCDGIKQFNVSYNKASQRSQEDMSNGRAHVTQLHATPGFTFVVNETPHSQKRNTPSQETDDLDPNVDFSGGLREGKQFRKTMSHPSNGSFGIQTFGTDLKPVGYGKTASCMNEGLLTISDISLRTQPSRLPPPSRPPPVLAVKDGDSDRQKSKLKASKSFSFGEKAVDSFPPFFDVEVDASSSASVSAAVMKDAMGKAQTKLISAKELMERKKEDLQSCTKLGLKNDTKDKEGIAGKTLDGSSYFKDERVRGTCQSDCSGMRTFAMEQSQKVMKTTQVVSDSIEGERRINVAKLSADKKHGKEYRSAQEYYKTEGPVAWREAAQFFEVVEIDKSTKIFEQAKDERVLVQNTQFYERGRENKATPAFQLQEHDNRKIKDDREACEWDGNKGRLKATKESNRQEEHEKKVKVNQEVCKQEENGKKTRMAQQHGDIVRILIEADRSKECENLAEVQQKENEVEVAKKLKEATETIEDEERHKDAHEREENERRLKEILERERYEKRLKQAIEQAEIEKRLKEALDQEEKEKQQRVACEREEKEKRQKEAREREEKEKRQKEVREREDNEKRLKEACEREENEKRLKEALEQEENKKRLKEALEREETERRLRLALEQEEKEKRQKEAREREDNEKRLKEACEREENEKRLKEALEQEENKKRLKEALEREETERRLKLALEQEEKEKRQKEAREREDNEKRLKEASEREENERRLKEALEQEENKKRLKEALEREETERRLKLALEQEEKEKRQKEAREREDNEKRLKEVLEQEENKKRLKEALEQEETERRLKLALEQEEKEKRQKEAREREDNEKKLKEALEQEENKKRVKEALEREETERRLKLVLEQEEKEKRQKEAREREDNEKRLKEALEWEETERRLKLVLEQEEKEKRQKEAREREDNEKRLKEALEQEENMKRLKEAMEREETETRLKMALEQEEKEKRRKEAREREDNEKRLKEACEREENEKRLKEALEQQENKKRLIEAMEQEETETRLKMALEREENEKKQKLAHLRDENEKRLVDNLRREEIEKKLTGALRQEESAKKQKEAHEREENEERLIEACERKENEKRLKEAWDQEVNKKQLQEAHEREESEKRSKEAFKQKEIEKRSEEANEREETQKRIEDEGYWEELKGRGKDHEQNERDENGRKLKSDQGTCVHTDENFKASDGACKLDDFENLQPDQAACRQNKNSVKVKMTKGALSFEEDRTLKVEPRGSEGQVEAVEVVEEQSISFDMAQDDPQHEKNQTRMKDFAESLHMNDTVKESVEAGIGIGQTHMDKNKKASEIASNPGKPNVITREVGARGNNVKEVQVTFDKEESKDKFMSSQVVRELIENGRKMGANQPTVLERKRNAQSTAQKVSTSQNTERKGKNLNDILTSEEREKEDRIKRERELEKDRLRKIEEEKEREREREKDLMAVDRATLEARERAFAEARERAERAAVERATSEVRQRVMTEARERLEKACAEVRERSLAEKASMEARLRAERAAVERATAEARERAFQKAMAEKATFEARERVERSVSDKSSASYKLGGMRQSSSFSDVQCQGVRSSVGSIYSYSSVHGGVEGESAQRCKARLERHRRTAERAAKALAEKNMRDLLAQKEQAERNRLAETLDAEVKRWSSGKEANLRALLSTLQYILGPDSGWQPIPLTEVITSAAVKKAYRKATLCVHPDKLQQRGASIQQKYICEKVFDLLKEAWNKFNSEER